MPDADPVHALWLIKYGHLVGNYQNTVCCAGTIYQIRSELKVMRCRSAVFSRIPRLQSLGVRQNLFHFWKSCFFEICDWNFCDSYTQRYHFLMFVWLQSLVENVQIMLQYSCKKNSFGSHWLMNVLFCSKEPVQTADVMAGSFSIEDLPYWWVLFFVFKHTGGWQTWTKNHFFTSGTMQFSAKFLNKILSRYRNYRFLLIRF